jgi:hypothetical protein
MELAHRGSSAAPLPRQPGGALSNRPIPAFSNRLIYGIFRPAPTACDSIERWWQQHGRPQYPQASKLLLLCDGGGSNSASRYVFKEELQGLANRLGMDIRVAHYPPYCSKYNPIEHRLFPHVTRACQGVVFHTVRIVKGLMEKTKTRTGLAVTVDIIDKVYQVGRKCAKGFKENMKIVFDDFLPKWNYRALPAVT